MRLVTKITHQLMTEQRAVIKAPDTSPIWACLSECSGGLQTGPWMVPSEERH